MKNFAIGGRDLGMGGGLFRRPPVAHSPGISLPIPPKMGGGGRESTTVLFERAAALSRQIRTFPQLFRFCSDLGNSGIPQIVRNSILTGRCRLADGKDES